MEVTEKYIKDLVAKALGGGVEVFYQQNRKRDLEALKKEIKEKKEELRSLQETVKAEDFSDEPRNEKDKAILKIYTGSLVPNNIEYISSSNKQLDVLRRSLSAYLELYVQTKDEITKLKEVSEKLKKDAESFTGEALEGIIREIGQTEDEISKKEEALNLYHGNIVHLLWNEASVEAEISENKAIRASLEVDKNNLKSTLKEAYLNTAKKAFYEAQITALKNAIHLLEERKRILASDPREIGEEIKILLKEDKRPEEVQSKLELLTMLANYSSDSFVDYVNNVGYQRVDSKRTKGQIETHIDVVDRSLSDSYTLAEALNETTISLAVHLAITKECLSELENIQNSTKEVNKTDNGTKVSAKVLKDSIAETKEIAKDIHGKLKETMNRLYSEFAKQRGKKAVIEHLKTYLMLQESKLDDPKSQIEQYSGIMAVVRAVASDLRITASPEELKAEIVRRIPAGRSLPFGDAIGALEEESYDITNQPDLGKVSDIQLGKAADVDVVTIEDAEYSKDQSAVAEKDLQIPALVTELDEELFLDQSKNLEEVTIDDISVEAPKFDMDELVIESETLGAESGLVIEPMAIRRKVTDARHVSVKGPLIGMAADAVKADNYFAETTISQGMKLGGN